jgi:hypothetical protein
MAKAWAWIVKAAQDVFSFVMKYVDMAISVLHEPGTVKISAKRVFLAFLVYSFIINLRAISSLRGFSVVALFHFIPAAFVVWAIRNKKA